MLGEGVPKEFPRRGIPRVLFDRRIEVRDGRFEFGALQVFASK
jgi:hypothetical protein